MSMTMPQEDEAQLPIELSPASGRAISGQNDQRPKMPVPPPVWLVAVADITLLCAPGMGELLDAFYVDLLRLEKESEDETRLVYVAQNFRVVLLPCTGLIERTDLRPLGVEVPSLAEVERSLIERQTPYLRQKSVVGAHVELMLQDPAGNWVRISERRLLG